MQTFGFLKNCSVVAAVVVLAACGGSDDTPAPTVSATVPAAADVSAFVTSYKQALGSLTALNATAFSDLVDDGFLDAGYNKAQLRTNLTADATALSANPTTLAADTVFPLVALDSATLGTCDDKTGVCQLTATYVNPNPDATRSTDTVQVRFSGGKLRLYGDQKTS
jgi:hypothetical protein